MSDESGARVSEAMFAMGGGADTRARTLCSPSSARAPSGAAQRGSFPSSYSHSGTVMTSPELTGARSERTRRPPPGAAATAARDIRAARAASEVSAAPRSPSHARGANRGSDRTLPAPKARGMARRTAGATRTVLASMASRSRVQRAAGSSWRSARPSESAGCVSAGCPSARFSGPDATTAFATPSTGGSATRPRPRATPAGGRGAPRGSGRSRLPNSRVAIRAPASPSCRSHLFPPHASLSPHYTNFSRPSPSPPARPPRAPVRAGASVCPPGGAVPSPLLSQRLRRARRCTAARRPGAS